MKVRFDPGAFSEVAAIYAHIAADNPFAAAEVVERIETVADMLTQFPNMGRKLRYRPERMMLVTPYPYVIFYRVVGNELHVRRIRHAARRRPMLQEAAAEFRR